MIWKWSMPEDALSERADRVIQSALSSGLGNWENSPAEGFSSSRSKIHQWIIEGHVFLNGVKIEKPNQKIAPRDQVFIQLPEPRSLDLVPENLPLELLYEDEHLVVLNKPQGMTVHPSETQRDGTLVHALLFHFKNLSSIGGVFRPGIVHRLDKNTSGVMVVCKTDKAHHGLSEDLKTHQILRKYWALCYGTVSWRTSEFKLETFMDRSSIDRKKRAVTEKSGKKAITIFRKLEEYLAPPPVKLRIFCTFIEAKLETGRTHQVRVHLNHLKNSILGDPLYGTPSPTHEKWRTVPPTIREKIKDLPGQALHARKLGFTHPITKKWMEFESAPPESFQDVLAELRKFQIP